MDMEEVLDGFTTATARVECIAHISVLYLTASLPHASRTVCCADDNKPRDMLRAEDVSDRMSELREYACGHALALTTMLLRFENTAVVLRYRHNDAQPGCSHNRCCNAMILLNFMARE